MNRKLLFSLLLSICCLAAYAQPHDLVAASGATFQNSSGYLSYSIGEAVTMTYTSSSVILTQGFHQAELQSGVPVLGIPDVQMAVYPNPVKNLLTLQVERPEGFIYILYDLRGRMLGTGQMLDEHMEIDFTVFEPAIYILKVTNHEEARLFQIVKY
jgi:hypothetical protein